MGGWEDGKNDDDDDDDGGCILHRLYILFAHVNILGWFCSPLELKHIQINDITRTYACLLSTLVGERDVKRGWHGVAYITRAKGWSSLPARAAARAHNRGAHFARCA